ncbi:hypothetical protein DMC30DRAFT_67900 [Rhodotorula diobovata]|uniref:Hemerythrin-like domain-containing protein n=1 Tax=Rhodotorula diobovata TaxID=5288 RepID=A0A5C5G1Y3_9BASI|nr:hypothetical protein DMC30DRAFT_67900 [Rhodotorula diobovata]
MSSSTHTGDVYSEIITDHNNVKDLYQRYKQATNKDEKATLVNTIIHELAVHSEAEEVRAPLVSPPASCRAASLTLRAPARRQVSVYNDLEKRGLASESKLLRDEHEELEKQLYSVDWTKVDSADFAPKFEKAIQLFIQHSDREEDEILKDLSSKLSPEDNDRLAKEFLAKRNVVPTRPHPAAPQGGGAVQKVLGMATKPCVLALLSSCALSGHRRH